MNEIDLTKFNLRTDLIIENNNLNHEEKIIDGIIISKTVNDGNYYTILFNDITNFENREVIGKHLENILKELLTINKIKNTDSCLIIGLGNSKSTPDSLGVKTLENIVITSHLFKLGHVKEGIRKVSAITPGVMANTGIESATIIKSIINSIKPSFVIAIDALASRSIDKINKTIQITDTGIHPGSGVGNNREEINKKNMHIPIIAIGVPTVTMSSTIVFDTINYLSKHISYLKNHQDTLKLTYQKRNYQNKLSNENLSKEDKANLLGLFGSLSNQEQLSLIEEVLTNIKLNLIVTPTEIDFLIDKLSSVISSSINNALHRQINNF